MKKLLLAALLATSSLASAEDIGVLIGNSDYRYIDPVENGHLPLNAEIPLREAGYTVISSRDATGDALARMLNEVNARIDSTDKLVVVLSGWFFAAGRETYFAPVDLRGTSIGTIATDALPIETLLNVMSQRKGESVLMLASTKAWGDDGRKGQLFAGIGDVDVPEGVLLVVGRPDSVDIGLRERLLVPGADVVSEVKNWRRLSVRGNTDIELSLVDTEAAPRIVIETDDTVVIDRRDVAYWQASEDLGTRDAYRSYLERYPQGRYAWLAKQRLAELDAQTPRLSPAEQAELALSLSRQEKRQMQRYLGVLGFDPKGVDGIIGPATRTALRAWQSANNVARTGYFTEGSVALIRSQAQAQIARQKDREDRRRAELRQNDRSYWNDTGATDTRAGLRAYLDRYPSGLYADQARLRLRLLDTLDRRDRLARERSAFAQARQIDTIRAYRNFIDSFPRGEYADDARERIAFLDQQGGARRERIDWEAALAADAISVFLDFLNRYPESGNAPNARARVRELQAQGNAANQRERETTAWQRTLADDTVGAYRKFLKRYPDSLYRTDAQQRISELRGKGKKAKKPKKKTANEVVSNRAAAARDEERRLKLSQDERRLVEAKLLGIGQQPGPVDGKFTKQTRATIKAYQRSRRLEQTGYLDKKTFESIMSGI